MCGMHLKARCGRICVREQSKAPFYFLERDSVADRERVVVRLLPNLHSAFHHAAQQRGWRVRQGEQGDKGSDGRTYKDKKVSDVLRRAGGGSEEEKHLDGHRQAAAEDEQRAGAQVVEAAKGEGEGGI
jgi:hypothetical protein